MADALIPAILLNGFVKRGNKFTNVTLAMEPRPRLAMEPDQE